MSKILKTYEEHITKDENLIDINYEDKIDDVLKELLKRKQHISLLRDTIEYVCKDLEKSLPDVEQFMAVLQHYDDDVFEAVSEIKENMLDGMPNIKDFIENVFHDFDTIERYIKNKK